MEKIEKWWNATNTFFTYTYLPQDNDKVTNGEIVLLHIGAIVGTIILGLCETLLN